MRQAGVYQNLSQLMEINIKDAVDSSNPILVKFLKSLAGMNEENQRQMYHLARTIEMIYKLTHHHIVYPLAFLNNLHAYVETGSRSVVDLNGVATGGGCSGCVGSSKHDE